MSTPLTPASRALHIACADVDGGRLFPVQFVAHPADCLNDRQRWEQARAEVSMQNLAEELFRAGLILGWAIKDSEIPAGVRLDNYPTAWATKWSHLRASIQTWDRRFVPQSAYRDRSRIKLPSSMIMN